MSGYGHVQSYFATDEDERVDDAWRGGRKEGYAAGYEAGFSAALEVALINTRATEADLRRMLAGRGGS